MTSVEMKPMKSIISIVLTLVVALSSVQAEQPNIIYVNTDDWGIMRTDRTPSPLAAWEVPGLDRPVTEQDKQEAETVAK